VELASARVVVVVIVIVMDGATIEASGVVGDRRGIVALNVVVDGRATAYTAEEDDGGEVMITSPTGEGVVVDAVSMGADAEELVKALMRSRREREDAAGEEEEEEEGAPSSPTTSAPAIRKDDEKEEHEGEVNYGFHKAKLRDELESLRALVKVERDALEAVRRETSALQSSREATSSDEADVVDKLTRTRTELEFLESEQAHVEGKLLELTEDLEYQAKNSATVRKACTAEEARLRAALDALRVEIAEEEQRLYDVKSETAVAIDVLEENEDYIEKVQGKLQDLQLKVEEKAAVLRELDADHGALADELEQMRAKAKEESEAAERARADHNSSEAQARESIDNLKSEIKRLQEEHAKYVADIECSDAALAEAVSLLQVAKETAEHQRAGATSPSAWMKNPLHSPLTSSFRHVRGESMFQMHDSARTSPREPPSPVHAIRLFEDDAPITSRQEDLALQRLISLERAAEVAEARREFAEASARESEVRLRRMVDFISRSTSSSPTASPPCERQVLHTERGTLQHNTPSVIQSLESLRMQLASAVKPKQMQRAPSGHTTLRETSAREELHFKLKQLIDEVGRR